MLKLVTLLSVVALVGCSGAKKEDSKNGGSSAPAAVQATQAAAEDFSAVAGTYVDSETAEIFVIQNDGQVVWTLGTETDPVAQLSRLGDLYLSTPLSTPEGEEVETTLLRATAEGDIEKIEIVVTVNEAGESTQTENVVGSLKKVVVVAPAEPVVPAPTEPEAPTAPETPAPAPEVPTAPEAPEAPAPEAQELPTDL